MATKTIAWQTGSGNITLTYQGQGDGTITVVSDENNLDIQRSQNITVKTLDNTISRILTVSQAAGPNFRCSDGKAFIPIGSDYFNIKTT